MKKIVCSLLLMSITLGFQISALAISQPTDLVEILKIAKLPPSIAVLETESALLDAQKEEYSSQLSELDDQIDNYEESIEALEWQSKNLNNQFDSMASQRSEIYLQIDALNEQLESLPEETPENTSELQAYRDEIYRQIALYEQSLDSIDEQDEYIAEQIYNIPDQRDEYRDQIFSLSKQRIELKSQSDSIDEQKAVIESKINDEKLLTDFNIQAAYYNVCIAQENTGLLEVQLALSDKQIAIENLKMSLKIIDTTQNVLDELIVARDSIKGQLDSMSIQASLYKSGVVKLLESKPATITYTIPDAIEGDITQSLETLTENLIKNNSALKEYDANISAMTVLVNKLNNTAGTTDTTYKLRAAELEYTIAQRDEYKVNLEAYASNKYNEYYSIEAQYVSAIYGRSSLEKQLELLQINYEHGEISELELLTEQAKINQTLVENQSVVISKANLLYEIELISNGVIVQ